MRVSVLKGIAIECGKMETVFRAWGFRCRLKFPTKSWVLVCRYTRTPTSTHPHTHTTTHTHRDLWTRLRRGLTQWPWRALPRLPPPDDGRMDGTRGELSGGGGGGQRMRRWRRLANVDVATVDEGWCAPKETNAKLK